MEHSWKDKVLLITGASKGIGCNVVRMALDEGVKQVHILDIDESAGITLQNELNTKYGENKVNFVNCDVTNDEHLKECFNSALEDKSNEYVVVNGAGILNDSIQMYKKEIEINVTAVITGSLTALGLMRKDKGGKGGAIINISSVLALCPVPLTPIYNATKSAVLTFSTGLGADAYYSRSGVRVLTICFGVTQTGLVQIENMGTFDEELFSSFSATYKFFPKQRVESAATAVIEMYKKGTSGSTWLSNANKPVEDISGVVKEAYVILTEPVLKE